MSKKIIIEHAGRHVMGDIGPGHEVIFKTNFTNIIIKFDKNSEDVIIIKTDSEGKAQTLTIVPVYSNEIRI